MKYLLLIISAAGILFIACKKEKEQNEKLYIRGRLFITDTLTQNALNQPLSGKTVQLAEANGDTLNYLFSKTTDSNGYFIFDLLNDAAADKKFVVRYDEKISNYWYTARDTVLKGEENLAMTARLDFNKQNGFYIYVQDSLGGKIPGASVAIYNSPVLADINDPAAAMETITTNSDGRVVKLNLAGGTYYLNTKKQADTIIFHRLKRQIIIPQKGLIKPTPDTIMLLRKR